MRGRWTQSARSGSRRRQAPNFTDSAIALPKKAHGRRGGCDAFYAEAERFREQERAAHGKEDAPDGHRDGPEHAPRALAREVEREAHALEGEERADDADVGGRGFDRAGVCGEGGNPRARKESEHDTDRARQARGHGAAGQGHALGAIDVLRAGGDADEDVMGADAELAE